MKLQIQKFRAGIPSEAGCVLCQGSCDSTLRWISSVTQRTECLMFKLFQEIQRTEILDITTTIPVNAQLWFVIFFSNLTIKKLIPDMLHWKRELLRLEANFQIIGPSAAIRFTVPENSWEIFASSFDKIWCFDSTSHWASRGKTKLNQIQSNRKRNAEFKGQPLNLGIIFYFF